MDVIRESVFFTTVLHCVLASALPQNNYWAEHPITYDIQSPIPDSGILRTPNYDKVPNNEGSVTPSYVITPTWHRRQSLKNPDANKDVGAKSLNYPILSDHYRSFGRDQPRKRIQIPPELHGVVISTDGYPLINPTRVEINQRVINTPTYKSDTRSFGRDQPKKKKLIPPVPQGIELSTGYPLINPTRVKINQRVKNTPTYKSDPPRSFERDQPRKKTQNPSGSQGIELPTGYSLINPASVEINQHVKNTPTYKSDPPRLVILKPRTQKNPSYSDKRSEDTVSEALKPTPQQYLPFVLQKPTGDIDESLVKKLGAYLGQPGRNYGSNVKEQLGTRTTLSTPKTRGLVEKPTSKPLPEPKLRNRQQLENTPIDAPGLVLIKPQNQDYLSPNPSLYRNDEEPVTFVPTSYEPNMPYLQMPTEYSSTYPGVFYINNNGPVRELLSKFGEPRKIVMTSPKPIPSGPKLKDIVQLPPVPTSLSVVQRIQLGLMNTVAGLPGANTELLNAVRAG